MALTLPPEPRKQLLVDKIRRDLSDADLAMLDGWLADLTISNRRIADALTADGHPVTASAVLTWRGRHVPS